MCSMCFDADNYLTPSRVGRYQEETPMPILKVTVGERERLDQRTPAEADDDLNDVQPVVNTALLKKT